MAKRILIKNETIPNASKILGQSSMSYKTGGAFATSFNSTDLYNFDTKDEGVVEPKDPTRTYLTTTFYPIFLIESAQSSAKEVPELKLTGNLYVDTVFYENAQVGSTQLSIPVFRKVLFDVFLTDSTLLSSKNITVVLRNVLKTYGWSDDNFWLSTKDVSFVLRSVLLQYALKDSAEVEAKELVIVDDISFSKTFTSYLTGDSLVKTGDVSDKVNAIKDLAKLTWTIPDTLTITKDDVKEGYQSLVVDEAGEGFVSKESLGISSEEGVEVMFENWFKPDLSTTSLLSTYGSTLINREKSAYVDKINGGSDWRARGNNFVLNKDYVMTNVDYLVRDSNSIDTRYTISNPVIGSKGTTVELSCYVEGTDRIILLSNGTSSLTSSGQTLAIVWYGASSNEAFKNKVCVVTDDINLKDSNNHLIVSQNTFESGSDLDISLVAYNGYYKLFVNGVLQGVKAVAKDFNFATGGQVYIGRSNWYGYTSAHLLKVKSFRFTKMALFIENSYSIRNPYLLHPVPNINRLSAATKYTAGVTCGLRYLDTDNTTRLFASITDTYDQTFTVESQPVDCSKWNYVQLANTGSELTLFINGVATSSVKLPYNIRFREVVVSSKDSANYRGTLDSFRIYSKLKDVSNRRKTSDLFFKINGAHNTALYDIDPDLQWVNKGVISTSSETPYRAVKQVGGFYTETAQTIVGDAPCYVQATIKPLSFKAPLVALTNESGSFPTSFNIATKAVKFNFVLSNTAGASLVQIGDLSVEFESRETYSQPFVKIGSFRIELPAIFRPGINYSLAIFQLQETLYFYVDGKRALSLRNTTAIQANAIVKGVFSGTMSNVFVSDITTSSRILFDNRDTSTGQGLQVVCYELFENRFLFCASTDAVNLALTDEIVQSNITTIRATFENKRLYLSVNGVASEALSQATFYTGLPIFGVCVNATTKATSAQFEIYHFESSVTMQDALLTTTYALTKIENETLFKNAVLAISSDSDYDRSFLFDRNSSTVSKDIINNGGVSKSVFETGLYFYGDSHLKLDSHADFVFGTEPFYMEFEVKTSVTTKKQVILDRTISGAGSWSVAINTDGHLHFNTTTASGVQTVDVGVKLNDNKWHKMQIDRSEKTYKFFLDGVEVYEYLAEELTNFNATGMDLLIGKQNGDNTGAFNFTGYLNNIRVVKGLSITSDFDIVSTEDLLDALQKVIESPYEIAVTNAIESFAQGLDYTIDEDARYISIEGTFTNLWRNVTDGGLPFTFTTVASDTLSQACGKFITDLSYIDNYTYNLEDTTDNVDGGVCHIGIYNPVDNSLQNVSDVLLVDEGSFQQPPRLVTFTEIAQKIVENARSGDSLSKLFLGLSSHNSEETSLYKSSSTSVFAISSVEGTIYDSRRNFWSAVGVTSILGPAPVNKEWLSIGTSLESDAAVLRFTETSNFTIELSVAVDGRQNVDRPFLQSINRTTTVTLLAFGVLANNAGLYLDVRVGSSTIRRTVTVRLEESAWYNISVCKQNDQIYFYINNLKYVCEPITGQWSVATNYKTRLLMNGMKLEAIKVSAECVYFINKTKEYQFLSNSLNFENNQLDSGNDPVEWFYDNVTEVSNGYLKAHKMLQLEATSSISAVNILPVGTNPFSVDLQVRFDSLAASAIYSLSSDDIVFTVARNAENKIFASVLVDGEEAVSVENGYTLTANEWITITLSRDYGGILTLAVNGVQTYGNGFNQDVTGVEFNLTGFVGKVQNIKVFTNSTHEHKFGLNILKLDFEREIESDRYIVEKAQNRVLKTYNTTTIKGLSRTSANVMFFDGASSYVEVPQMDWMDFQKDYFEIEFSIYPVNGLKMYQTILGAPTGTLTANSPYIMLFGSTQPSEYSIPVTNRIAIGSGSNGNPLLVSTSQINYNVWTKIRFVRRANVLFVYINGLLDNTVQFQSDLNMMNTGGLLLGKNGWAGAESYYHGYLDDLKISRFAPYSEPTTLGSADGLLSAIDFEDVGTTFDIVDSGLTNNLDSYGNAWSFYQYRNQANLPVPRYRTVSAVNDAIYFEGGSLLYAHNKHFSAGLSPFTISVDFSQTVRDSDNFIFYLSGCYCLYVNSTGSLCLWIGGSTYVLSQIILDKWYTCTITRDDSYTLRVFIDGKVKLTVPNFKTNFTAGYSLYPMCLGGDWDLRDNVYYPGRFWKGFIDNFLFDRGTCRYTVDHVVFADKAEGRKNTSLIDFKDADQSVIPDLSNNQLTWSVNGIIPVTDAAYVPYAGKGLTTSSYAVSTAHAWNLSRYDFTVDLIFKPSQITSEAYLLDMATSSSLTEGIQILQSATNPSAITVRIGSAGSTAWALSMHTGNNTLTTSKVYHLRVCRNLGTIYIFLDGVLRTSSAYLSTVDIGSTVTLFNNQSRNKGFTGTIEQFRFIKDHALSAIDSFKDIKESF